LIRRELGVGGGRSRGVLLSAPPREAPVYDVVSPMWAAAHEAGVELRSGSGRSGGGEVLMALQ